MGRWNPWAALRERAHLTLRWARLDGILGYLERDLVVLDDRLDRPERNAVLAHELVHEERGVVVSTRMPAGWGPAVVMLALGANAYLSVSPF